MNSRLLRAFVIFVSFGMFLVPRIAHSKTPLGLYQKGVYDQLGRVWYRHLQESNPKSISLGVVAISFRITPKGQVEKLKVLSNTSNKKGADIAVQSIREAKFAPLPKTVLTELTKKGQDWLDEEMTFTLYPHWQRDEALKF
jgi:hypothetical protein